MRESQQSRPDAAIGSDRADGTGLNGATDRPCMVSRENAVIGTRIALAV